jgi:hypothetical protein
MVSRVLLNNFREQVAQKRMLQEGGAYGHMNHPFEDVNLTFGDMKRIISLSLEGKLDNCAEKTDGQNILVSHRTDRGAIFARNKSHLRNQGIEAMGVDGVREMFEGRGTVSDAFSLAAVDLENAISALTPKQLAKIFNDGTKWMSVEIIYPATRNVIPYNHNLLVFHNTVEMDKDGNAIGIGDAEGRMLAGMVKQINQHVQDTFTVSGPNVVTLPKSKNFAQRRSHYTSKLNKLQRQFRLSDNDPLLLWHQRWWEAFIDTKASQFKYRMPNTVRVGLLQRWAFSQPGAFTINNMKKEIGRTNDPRALKFLDWALVFDRQGKADQRKENLAPFESIFLQLGAEVLQNLSGLIALSPGEAAETLRKELNSAVKTLSTTKDIKKMNTFKANLAKLDDIGLDKLVPTEGITFMFNGRMFKLTGAFAPLHQLLRLLKDY